MPLVGGGSRVWGVILRLGRSGAVPRPGSPAAGFRAAAAARVTFSAWPEKVTKERPPRMTRLPGLWPSRCAGGLRGFSTGHPALAKNWPASMRATLRAFLHPPAASYGDPKGQEPEQELQVYCRSAPCARPSYGAVHPSVAVAHRVRSYRKTQTLPRAPAPHPGPLPGGERDKWGASRRQAKGDAQRAPL